jgi:DNA-binding NarL/FixJ family response regulator
MDPAGVAAETALMTTPTIRILIADDHEIVRAGFARFIADLAVKDVARIVGKRQGAVKMLQARGLERLHELLQVQDGA